ncbi:hypothetical protein Q3C01_12845 [Bradyrhizobium sp. UFLA05-109]
MQDFEGIGRIIELIKSNEAEIGILDPRIRIACDGEFETFYAPFEHINTNARVTIVGLTPGQTQARIALNETCLGIKSGLSWKEAIERAKYLASFGGPMRTNLTRMLDHIGLNKLLGIDTCALLFSEFRSLAHHTSILRYPVFRNKLNYSGQPSVDRISFLRNQVDKWFAAEPKLLSKSVFIPLGAQVQQVFARVAREAGISEERCLSGLPHPSGANAERIAYFLGKKSKEDLSAQTDGNAIDLVRDQLISKMRVLRR